MNATISLQQLNGLRKEFKEYLRDQNPGWRDSTVSTVGTDAFFALNNNVGVDFWASLVSDEAFIKVCGGIRDFLESTKSTTSSEERANGYVSALRQLKQFLDEKYPTLATEWSGKAISDVNLRADFRAWMTKQKKANGDSYSSNTVTLYISSLRRSTAQLGLGYTVDSDLFNYTLPEEFEAARKEILAAPNFDSIDAAAGNKAYSSGMVLYARFLKERDEPSAWIFQGNPKYYDLVGAVDNRDTLTWGVNQYSNLIKRGDRAYIWVSGSDGGIIAAGTVLCNPEMKPADPTDPYRRGETLKAVPYLGVDIALERKFTSKMVPRGVLLADERTKHLEILTFPGATNFRVMKTQEDVIESIINGNYERVDDDDGSQDEPVGRRRYWLYAPGHGADMWDDCYAHGLMAIGWDGLGDLGQYASKDDIQTAMKREYGEESSHKNGTLALWQFVHDINVGDVIIVKKGMHLVIGRGVVQSEYEFDDSRRVYKNIRKVNWTHKGEWDNPGQAPRKTLTDFTADTEYVERLKALFLDEDSISESEDEPEIVYTDYSIDDFLSDVFMDAERYESLKGLLKRKKNVILQGPPGVGKTYAAQRLAFSIMGAKDTSRVRMVQFHQSYSYEDFVMGYRPDGNGFRLVEGPFYRFCKAAESDDKRPYYFIIDEINRGNLSKIFGELLMLIEGDKRGEKNAIRLLYKDEQFFVPPNVHIIGMMNTADRSLAMIDYALRRRFAFFDLEPAFESDGFRIYQTTIQNRRFDALVSVVQRLNRTIAEDASLGAGFRIGHSYFCTSELVDDAWLSSVVEYELIPLLHEYWFDEPTKAETWSAQLRSVLNG